ncbi:MAG: hypothetical protein PHS45_03095 [Bacilli bacterium]|nr:hypothetical protein [Bacilli bacterium]
MKKKKKKKVKRNNWIYKVFTITFILSMLFGALSNAVTNNLNIFIAVFILILIILTGILFDIIGMAVASTKMGPFTAKAARKHKGAKEAIKLIKDSDRVTNVCNDVVGDVCGIISGAMGAVISIRLSNIFNFDVMLISLIIGSIIASFTVLGKAMGKTIAMDNNINIVYQVGTIIHIIKGKKNKKHRVKK